MNRPWLTFALVLFSFPLLAEVVLRTTGGETLRGTGPQITTNGFVLRSEGGESINVPLRNVLQWSRTGEETSTNASSEQAATDGGPREAAEAGWEATTIGSPLEGKATEEGGGVWTVVGGGRGIQGSSDSAFLVHQRLQSSGQLVGQVVAFDGTSPEAMAGLMLRDNLGEAAAYAFVGQRIGSGLCFQYRQIAGGMTMRVTNVAQPLPAWFRLSRVGGSVVAEMSLDGRTWQPLGKANVNLGQSVRAGMVVSAGVDKSVVTGRFGTPAVGARGMSYVAASGFPRLLFRNGSILVAPVASADESVVRLGGGWEGTLVSVVNLARIEFVPLNPELRSHLDEERRGVLLVEGDYFDGALRSLATNTVTMSSLLFGFRRFGVGSEAGLIQLGSVQEEEGGYVLTLQNGSVLKAGELDAGEGWIRARSPLLGAVTVPIDLVKQIRRVTPEL